MAKYLPLVGIGLIASAAMIGPAVSTHWMISQNQIIKLRVPVKVSNMYPQVPSVGVRCQIFNAQDKPLASQASQALWPSVFEPLQNGALDKVLELNIELSDSDFHAARKYTCRLLVTMETYPGPVWAAQSPGPGPGGGLVWSKGRPGEFFRREVSGLLIEPVEGLQLTPNN